VRLFGIIIRLEKDVSSIQNRKQLTKLYYLMNQKEKSVKILKGTIPLIESAKAKKEIDMLIEKYAI
jgi:hypothetical protein